MKKSITILSACMAALIALLAFTSCGTTVTDSQTTDDTSLQALQSIEVDETGATAIVFDGETASVAGTGASVQDTDVIIGEGGTYTVRGETTDGRIVVDAADADVTIILNGAQIACADSSAIYVYKAAKAIVYAKEGTTNTLSDGTSYTYDDAYASKTDEEPNACLYSKADLILAGSGSLTVNGNAANGVTSKDTLLLDTLDLTVQAANNGVTGKDSLSVKDATVTVTAEDDALRATNDTDEALGYIVTSGATLDLTAGSDGMQVETYAALSDTTATVRTGGGSEAQLGDDASAKGVKAGTDITIDAGSYTFDCADDAVHANGNVTIRSGELSITSGDDAIHADNSVDIDDGTIEITAHEGIEGTLITINGGKISIHASDDGINAAKKDDSVTPTVEINGGEIEIEMGQGDTDGVDSNGDIIINGGTIRVTGQSTFDYDGKGELNGGEVYVNGEKVTTLPNQFGGMGGGRQGGLNGERPQLPDGEMPSFADGERPQLPDGEIPSFADGERPQPPDGEMPSFADGERPQRPQSGKNTQSGSTASGSET